MNVFNLPDAALVDKFVAKSKFYEKAALSSNIQDEFVDKIRKITWKYKLAENTIGISKTNDVTEIQIFEIELKEQVIPRKVLRIIDTSIPYQILYHFVYNGNFAYGITLKDTTGIGNYYFSDWNEPIHFDFTGIDLEKVYQKLVKSFLETDYPHTSDFNAIIDREKSIQALEKQIAGLESKIAKEKQFNRKVEMHKMLLEKKQKLKNV